MGLFFCVLTPGSLYHYRFDSTSLKRPATSGIHTPHIPHPHPMLCPQPSTQPTPASKAVPPATLTLTLCCAPAPADVGVWVRPPAPLPCRLAHPALSGRLLARGEPGPAGKHVFPLILNKTRPTSSPTHDVPQGVVRQSTVEFQAVQQCPSQ